MERVRGIEPPYSAWEADVLPLNYTRAYPTHYPASKLTKQYGINLYCSNGLITAQIG